MFDNGVGCTGWESEEDVKRETEARRGGTEMGVKRKKIKEANTKRN